MENMAGIGKIVMTTACTRHRCVCVCVCVSERERERESVDVYDYY